ncbi:MAG TPA: LuxR C-terminal-related transcriptional regulator, partial [Mycobacterium sp.]|nr:LuxR C-terminal-related transcriptional regulator [Mycobacterium sp.]
LLAPVEGDESIPRLRLMQGWLKAGMGDYTASLAILGSLLDGDDDFRDPWPWSPPWMRILAQIGLDAGHPDFARRAAHIADLVAQRNPGVPTLDGTALHANGLLANDPDLLGNAARILRQSPRPLVLADALKDYGSTLLARDRSNEGVAALVEAAEIYRRVGATAGGRSVSKLLRGHGIRGIRVNSPVPRPPTGWAALTPTESRVVELISGGHSNRSAASELGVSPNTVNTHLRAVFRKLDVKSRVQLTIAYREHAEEDYVSSAT